MSIRRAPTINNTKIQYLSVADTKIYKVKNIDFCNLTIEASETDLSISDVPENKVFPLEELAEFQIRLRNGNDSSRVGEIINFVEWIKIRSMIG